MNNISDLLQAHGRVWFYISDEYKETFYSELCALGAHFQNGNTVTEDLIGNIMAVHADGTVGYVSYMIWYNTFSVHDAPVKVDYAKYRTGQSDYVLSVPNVVPLGWETKEKIIV